MHLKTRQKPRSGSASPPGLGWDNLPLCAEASIQGYPAPSPLKEAYLRPFGAWDGGARVKYPPGNKSVQEQRKAYETKTVLDAPPALSQR